MDHDVLNFAQVMTVIIMSVAAFVVIGLGARVLWRLGSRTRPHELSSVDPGAIQRLETAVDAIAIEVERISEGQRFTVSLLAEQLPARRSERAPDAPVAGTIGRVNTPH